MYFNESNESTNIDKELKDKKNTSFFKDNFKGLVIFIAVIAFIILLLIIINALKNRNKYHITLYNGDNIDIYQGMEYAEIGYEAYDNKNNNVTGLVKVKGTVDNYTIGTYTVTYSIGNTVKKRTVRVIDPSENRITFNLIHPEPLEIKVGDKYYEPGYTVTDKVDGLITENVIKNFNNLNVEKATAGIYKIVYSVTNSSGQTGIAIRIVWVK